MSNVAKKGNNSVGRLFRKPSLIDYDAVDKYIELFGTPVCACCNTITLLPVFRLVNGLWAVYCLNCGTTRDTIGTCLHVEGEDMSKRMINPHKNISKILD